MQMLCYALPHPSDSTVREWTIHIFTDADRLDSAENWPTRYQSDLVLWVMVKYDDEADNTVGDFTFWISLSLRPSLRPKYGLRPKISEK